MARAGITVRFVPVMAKQASGEHKTWQLHYSAVVTVGDNAATFDYSAGYGCAAKVLKDNLAAFKRGMDGNSIFAAPKLRGLSSYACGVGVALATKGVSADRYTDKKAVAELMQWLLTAYTPDADSLIDCLRMDAQSGEDSFEDFCGNCGYDTDSRTAEQTWRACQEAGRKLRGLLGGKLVGELMECEGL